MRTGGFPDRLTGDMPVDLGGEEPLGAHRGQPEHAVQRLHDGGAGGEGERGQRVARVASEGVGLVGHLAQHLSGWQRIDEKVSG